jgi:hypothetical protein
MITLIVCNIIDINFGYNNVDIDDSIAFSPECIVVGFVIMVKLESYDMMDEENV